jgi:hypothetical protein
MHALVVVLVASGGSRLKQQKLRESAEKTTTADFFWNEVNESNKVCPFQVETAG